MFNYDNIGNKIKGLATGTFIIEAFLSLISGIALIFIGFDVYDGDNLIIVGIALLLFGPAIAWLSSLVLYGFGELIDKVCKIEENINKINSNDTNESIIETPEINNTDQPLEFKKAINSWVCSQCGTRNSSSTMHCKGCYNAKPEEIINLKSSKTKPNVEEPKTETPPTPSKSNKCKCGERYWGDICPNCGRKPQ